MVTSLVTASISQYVHIHGTQTSARLPVVGLGNGTGSGYGALI